MDDRFTKYSKLYLLIFLMFLSVPVVLAIIIAAFYGISKLVSSSIVDIIFGLGIVTLAPALFSTVYVIFFKRTKTHPVAAVRAISKTVFVVGIAVSVVVLVIDMIAFFTKFNIDIAGYRSFSLAYMAGNVALLFLIAIIQAFTTKKEVDWMDRRQ
ncbi:MAG: hypothetical protein IPL84_01665 [Chitinophagaceae bacterium]|nr:hypothetical protein [Chitinophagaceae bacterium]